MGRLTEFFGNGKSARGADVVVSGAEEEQRRFTSLMMKDPAMERAVRQIIRKALQKARNNTAKDIHAALKNDPRNAYKAVKHSAYKAVFGGSISILNKKKRGAPTNYIKPRKLAAGQRGGNRRKRSAETERRESYGNSDRGFILRFLNAGTDERQTRHGNRGSITARHLFSHIAPWHMDTVASDVEAGIKQLINYKANG